VAVVGVIGEAAQPRYRGDGADVSSVDIVVRRRIER
jgi:hypothetical protein